MQTRKNVVLWILYDFANSIVAIVFFLYFAQWIVVDRGVSDLYFNLSFTVAAALLLLTVPFMGVWLDRSLRRIAGLRFTTVSTAVLYGLCGLAAVTDREMSALIFFTLGLYAYLLSFTFYTPLLNDIVRKEKRGLVSGLGISANYAGQFAGLVIALPFSNGSFSFFQAAPRAETLLPAVIIFFVLVLPMLLFFDEPGRLTGKLRLWPAVKNTFGETRGLLAFPGVGLFIVAYFLFNDAILTASNNFPIFLEQVWHVSDTAKTYILLGILMTSAIGGTASGFLADRFGHKRTLMLVLVGWVFILPLVGFLTDFTLFVISTTLMGLWFGANWAVSRSLMSHLAPDGRHNLAFGYFGLAERASSFAGPIVWGLVVSNFVFLGSDRYRWATLAVTVFIVLGLIVLARVKDDRGGNKSFF